MQSDIDPPRDDPKRQVRSHQVASESSTRPGLTVSKLEHAAVTPCRASPAVAIHAVAVGLPKLHYRIAYRLGGTVQYAPTYEDPLSNTNV